MVTYMNDKKIRSLKDIRAFLTGSTQMEFSIEGKDERYRWIEQTLRWSNNHHPGSRWTDRWLLDHFRKPDRHAAH